MGEEIAAAPKPARRSKPGLPLPGGTMARFEQDGRQYRTEPNLYQNNTETSRHEEVLLVGFQN
jgi:hypothetical protein